MARPPVIILWFHNRLGAGEVSETLPGKDPRRPKTTDVHKEPNTDVVRSGRKTEVCRRKGHRDTEEYRKNIPVVGNLNPGWA